MLRLTVVFLIFLSATFGLWLLICAHPLHREIREARNAYWKFPLNFDNLSDAAVELQYCKQKHFAYTATLFAGAYLYKQAFAIPGSFFLNIAAGALFGFVNGLLICCVLTTSGAAISYLLSDAFGKQYVLYYFGPKVTSLQQKLKANSHRIFYFLVFARLFPISPSWLVNIAAPILDIPFTLFVVTTFVGLAPYNFVGVNAGATLSQLDSWNDVFTPRIALQFGLLSILPMWLAFVFAKPSRLPPEPAQTDDIILEKV